MFLPRNCEFACTPVTTQSLTYHEAVMAREQRLALLSLHLPQTQRVVLTGTHHVLAVLAGLDVSDGPRVASKFALALKQPGLPFRLRVKVQNLNLLVLRTNHKHVSSLGVVLDRTAAVDRVSLDLGLPLKGVTRAHELSCLTARDVDHTFERRTDHVLLIDRKVTGQNHSLGLLVLPEGLGGLSLIEEVDASVAAASGDLVSIRGKYSIIGLNEVR